MTCTSRSQGLTAKCIKPTLAPDVNQWLRACVNSATSQSNDIPAAFSVGKDATRGS